MTEAQPSQSHHERLFGYPRTALFSRNQSLRGSVNLLDVLHIAQTFFSRRPRRLVPQHTLGKMVRLPRKVHRVLLWIGIIDLDVRRTLLSTGKTGPQLQAV